MVSKPGDLAWPVGGWMGEQVEERSLRTHLIQLESERQRLLKAELVNGASNTSSSSYLSTP
jgi:hypothetical protein